MGIILARELTIKATPSGPALIQINGSQHDGGAGSHGPTRDTQCRRRRWGRLIARDQELTYLKVTKVSEAYLAVMEIDKEDRDTRLAVLESLRAERAILVPQIDEATKLLTEIDNRIAELEALLAVPDPG